jgi:hypothetical protein
MKAEELDLARRQVHLPTVLDHPVTDQVEPGRLTSRTPLLLAPPQAARMRAANSSMETGLSCSRPHPRRGTEP